MSVLGSSSPLDRASPDASLTEFDKRVYESVRKVMLLPDEFKDYLVQYFTLNQPPIPIGQIIGFSQFTFQPAPTIDTSEATTSTSYVDLATVGPSLTGLSNGAYALFYGCQITYGGAGSGIMSLEVNGSAATDTDSVVAAASANVSRLVLKDLASGNNTITAKYRSLDGTSQSFLRRWLIAVRYQNL